MFSVFDSMQNSKNTFKISCSILYMTFYKGEIVSMVGWSILSHIDRIFILMHSSIFYLNIIVQSPDIHQIDTYWTFLHEPIHEVQVFNAMFELIMTCAFIRGHTLSVKTGVSYVFCCKLIIHTVFDNARS